MADNQENISQGTQGETQPAVVQEQVKGVVKIGLSQLKNPTPTWANWVFRIFFWATNTISASLAILTDMPPQEKLKIVVYVQISTIAVHGVTRMIGVDESQFKV